jgi:hypothetical protein
MGISITLSVEATGGSAACQEEPGGMRKAEDQPTALKAMAAQVVAVLGAFASGGCSKQHRSAAVMTTRGLHRHPE